MASAKTSCAVAPPRLPLIAPWTCAVAVSRPVASRQPNVPPANGKSKDEIGVIPGEGNRARLL
jgi:hypothetical protein